MLASTLWTGYTVLYVQAEWCVAKCWKIPRMTVSLGELWHDEKWKHFENPDMRKQWLDSQKPLEQVPKRGPFEHKIMFCILQNFDSSINWKSVLMARALMYGCVVSSWSGCMLLYAKSTLFWWTVNERSSRRIMLLLIVSSQLSKNTITEGYLN